MYVVQLLGIEGTQSILAFAGNAAQAEDLVNKCAIEHIASVSGRERADKAYDAPEGEGLYLKTTEIPDCVEVWRKQIKKGEDGWIFSGTVELVDAQYGAVKAIEFDVDKLHCDSVAVVPIRSITSATSIETSTAFRPFIMPAKLTNKTTPYLRELKTHPKFQFQSI